MITSEEGIIDWEEAWGNPVHHLHLGGGYMDVDIGKNL